LGHKYLIIYPVNGEITTRKKKINKIALNIYAFNSNKRNDKHMENEEGDYPKPNSSVVFRIVYSCGLGGN